MARPKGSKGKRNETKYWFPIGVTLAPNQTNDYNKSTKLIFIDDKYGEFISNFHDLHDCGASTHKLAIQARREATNIIKYGGVNPHNSKEVKNKAKKTMLEKYGVENALQNPDLFKKSRDTLEQNHGVREMMKSDKIKSKLKQSFIDKYGVDNPMKDPSIVKAMEDDYFTKTGYRNPGQNPTSTLKAFNTMTKNGTERMSSKGELDMLAFVRSLGIEANKGFLGGAKPKEIDIKVPDLLLGIEYNGVYWHKDNKTAHKEKMLLAKAQGYKLLQFFDFEWESRNKQVKSFLRSALGKNEIKLNGRDVVVQEVEKTLARRFLNDFHILGAPQSFLKAIGLFYKEELVAMITIGRHHRTNKEIILSRYVGKENVTVRGGLNKLCKAAYKEFGPFTTFIDLRMSNGEAWLENGWSIINTSKPDYFYYDPREHEVISKQSRQKKKIGTPKEMTESEHAKNDGLHKIYDCGKMKLIYNG
jgi:hypothetical protein